MSTTKNHEAIMDARAVVEFEEDAHRAALEDNPDEVKIHWKTWAAVFSMAISFGPVLGLGFGAIASVVVPVSQELNGFDQLAWVVGAWSLSTACVFSIGGPLSDTFGRRNPILAGQLCSMIGFIMGGLSKNIATLIAAEAIIGLGTGLIFVSYAGVPEMLPNKYRALGLGILDGGISLPWGIVAVILAQSLVKYATWRWIFWIALICEAIGFAGTAIFYWPTSRPRADFEKTRLQQLGEIDWLGLLLFIGGICSFLVGITWGGQAEHPWEGASTLGPIIAGAVGVISAFVYDFWFATNPLFPLSLFKQFREYTVLLVVVFVSGMLYNSMLPLLTQGSLYMFTTDGVEIGLIAMPNTVITLIVGCFVPLFAHKIGHMRWQVVFAIVMQGGFTAATAAAVSPNNYHAWMWIPSFGVPMFTWVTILTYAIASLHVPHSRLGLAMGLLGTFRSAGGAVGNAIFSSVLNDRFTAFVGEEVAPVAFAGGYNATDLPLLIPGAIFENQGILLPYMDEVFPDPLFRLAVREAVRAAYGRAFRVVFLVTIPFSVVALIMAVFIEDPTKYMTNHVQADMHKDHRAPTALGNHGGSDVDIEMHDNSEKGSTKLTESSK